MCFPLPTAAGQSHRGRPELPGRTGGSGRGRTSRRRHPTWAEFAAGEFISTPAPARCWCTGWPPGQPADERRFCAEATNAMNNAKNSRSDRGRFRGGSPDAERRAVRGPGHRGDRHGERSLRRRRADRRASAGRDHAGYRDAPHGRPDVPAEDHEPAPDPGGHLLQPGRRGRAEHAAKRSNTARWISSPSHAWAAKQFLEESTRHAVPGRQGGGGSAPAPLPRRSRAVRTEAHRRRHSFPSHRRHARNHRKGGGDRRIHRRHRGACGRCWRFCPPTRPAS